MTSNDLICNTNFIQPVSTVVAQVPAGAQVTAHFHRTSAGYLGPSPSEPLDPTNKGTLLYIDNSQQYNTYVSYAGPVLAYLCVLHITNCIWRLFSNPGI